MSTRNEILETLSGVMAEFMLFLFTVCLVVAAADTLIELSATETIYGAFIAMMFLVSAGLLYSSRFFLDRKEWKGFMLTGIVAVLLQATLFANLAYGLGISPAQALQGSLAVLIGAGILTVSLYIFRIICLGGRWRAKRVIRRHSAAGEHRAAVKKAEEANTSLFRHKDYIQNPGVLSYSTALALAKSLDAMHRPEDACRVRLVAGGWSNEQAQSFLDECRVITLRNQ